MGGGLYSTEKKNFDKKLDMSKIKPYGDTMNDGKIQVSFTLPVDDGEKAMAAALELSKKMGIEEPSIAYHVSLDKGYTYFVLFGALKHSIDYTKIKVESVKIDVMAIEEINDFIKTIMKRKLIIIGATTGTDAHTVGIDAIMNRKGFAGHYGLEKYEMIDAYNLGSQVSNETFVEKAIKLEADVLLVSQTVTQKDIHVRNLTNLVDLLEAEGIRDKVVLICGGPRISHELAKELGFDAGFGPNTFSENVASYFVKEIYNRKFK
jgi:beta-lysine 5,6-aminomutase beta subunit